MPGTIGTVPPPDRRPDTTAWPDPALGLVRVLLVEDDEAIAEPLVEGLEKAGFVVNHVTTAQGALAAEIPELVLLDLGLPDLDGTSVARAIRASSDVPIIVVSAQSDEIDRVLLLELGADDYVVKPFGLRELVARMRAVLRRVHAEPPGPTGTPAEGAKAGGAVDGVGAAVGPVGGSGTPASGAIRPDTRQDFGRLVIDRRSRRVLVEGTEIELAPREYDLLALLASDPGAVFTRSRIIDEVWDPNWWGSTKTLDVHVAGLRRKLGQSDWITTIRGVGYRFDPR